MKTVAELLAEAREHRLNGHISNAIRALCDAIEQQQQWMVGCRMVVDAHNEHAVRTIDEPAIRADERERIARLFGAPMATLDDEQRAFVVRWILESAP